MRNVVIPEIPREMQFVNFFTFKLSLATASILTGFLTLSVFFFPLTQVFILFVDNRYRGIGIRIEDDILITNNGPEVLTAECPKEVEDIESLMNK